MSGALGLQGRYATAFGYGPRLGVGRYPARATADQNALLRAAQDYASGRGQLAAPAAPPETRIPIPELLPQVTAPVLAPAAAAARTAAAAEEGGSLGGGLLNALLPAALGIGGTWLLRKLLADPADAVAGGRAEATASPLDQRLDPAAVAASPQTYPVSELMGPSGVGGQGYVYDPGVPAVTFGGDRFGFSAAEANPFGQDVYWSPEPIDLTRFAEPQADAARMNVALHEPVFDLAGPDLGVAGPPEMGGAAFDLGALDWGVSSPGTGAFGLDMQVGPFTINPVNIGAGAIGSFLGSQLAANSVRGDEQQGWASSIGGTVGGGLGGLAAGAAFGSAFGPIGTLVGSLLGAFGAGSLLAGQPDDPFAAFGVNVAYSPQGPVLDFGSIAAGNSGQAAQVNALRDFIARAIPARAAAEGYVVNPERVNQGALWIGYHNRPGYSDPLFLRDIAYAGEGVKPYDALWRGTNDAAGWGALLDRAYGELLGRGVLVRPGSTASWEQVQQNLMADPGRQGQPITGFSQWTGEGAAPPDTPGLPVEQRTYWAGPAPALAAFDLANLPPEAFDSYYGSAA